MRQNQAASEAPTVQPGQIWVIEQTAASGLFALDRDALASANVVLYDRALAPLVARVLPLGTYAEPLTRDGSGGAAVAETAAISPRALKFAAEGWSVVQLVEARGGWRAWAHNNMAHNNMAASSGLRPLNGGAANLPVRVIAKTAADPDRDRRSACLPELAGLIDDLDADDLLTLVVGPVAARVPMPAFAFTANGLAG